MINFYSYHNGDLYKEEIYKQPMMILEDCGCLYDSVPEVENIIKKVPKWAFFHSFYVKKERWSEAEPYIMKSPGWAVTYAKGVIKGRWPEAESVIMKDPMAAYEYTMEVIKGRWVEAEPYLKLELFRCKYYEKRFGMKI